MISIVKITTLIISIIALSSCGGGGGSVTSSPTPTTSKSFLSAAPVNNATCDLYKVTNGQKDGNSMQNVTSNFGKVEFNDIAYSGTALIECSGGQYKDEATDKIKTPPVLRSVVDFSPTGNFAITPLTEIAYQMGTQTLNTVLGTHNITVAKAFGISSIDISTIHPTDIDNNNITNDHSGKYATILIALSKLEANGDEGLNMTAVIDSIKNDLVDSKLDYITSINITHALEKIKTINTDIASRIHHPTIAILKQNILKNMEKSALNDTGVFFGISSDNIISKTPYGDSDCSKGKVTPQDCLHGRDAGLDYKENNSTFTYVAGVGSKKIPKIGGGFAGFDFTKLDFKGLELKEQRKTWESRGAGLEAQGTKWSCVRDNVTGLVWEVKTDSGYQDTYTEDASGARIYTNINIHNKNNTYRWGGESAIGKNHKDRKGTYYDDWTGLVDGANKEKLCGFTNWRVPTINELMNLTNMGANQPAIDKHYFPNISYVPIWSSSPSNITTTEALWCLIEWGIFGTRDRSYEQGMVILVR